MRREAPGVRGARGVRPGGPGRRERHAADSLNGNLLVPFYREFIDAHPDVLLELHTSMSPDINREVEERAADVGLAFSLEHYPTIAARELFRDRWVVLCRRDHPFVSSADPNDLAGEAEVLMRYPAEYQTWHRHYFARFAHPKIIVSNASQLGAFLDTPGSLHRAAVRLPSARGEGQRPGDLPSCGGAAGAHRAHHHPQASAR